VQREAKRNGAPQTRDRAIDLGLPEIAFILA